MNPRPATRTIAYFSMEIALRPDIPTYSGGLALPAVLNDLMVLVGRDSDRSA